MRLPEDNDIKKGGVNILPMIDVIFAILAFFIVSTLYLTNAEGLPVNLPQATTATPQTEANLTLTITADGTLFLNEDSVTLEDLAREVRSRARNSATVITIRADKTTPHGRVVAAMDQLRTLDGVKLGIATTQP
jgi:biopolymer transport protein ExbD